MKKYIYILSFSFLIFTNCEKKATPFIDLFQENMNFEYEMIENLPEVFLYHPIRKIVVKDFIIIADFKTKKIFHVINKKTGDYFQFGDKGRGPHEFTDGYGLTNLSDTSFIVFDRMKEKVSFFSVIKESIEMYHEINVPNVNNIIPYSETLFITNGNFHFEKNYGVIDIDQNKVSDYIDYPEGDGNSIRENSRKYHTHLVRKPLSSRFIGIKSRHYMFDIIEINDEKELNLIERKIYEDFKWEKSDTSPLPTNRPLNIFAASKISVSNERIFVCYQANAEKEWFLLTFDWDGNPLDKYIIPFTPYTITSTNDSTLYSVGVFEDDYKLCKISLK